MTKSMLMLSDDAHVARACADLGVGLTVAYGAPQRDWGMMAPIPGQRQVFVENSTGLESVLLGLCRAGVHPGDFDAVYSTDESGVVTAAVLGKAFGMPSIPPDVAALFRDKALAKAELDKVGIDVARFQVIEDLHLLPRDFELPFQPAVLKPVAGGATQHATLVRSNADLQEAAKKVRENRQLRTFILEEFVPGDELHADGVMFDGQLRFISVGGYRKSCLSTIADNDWLQTYVLDPVVDADVYERVTPLAERALNVLGLRDGVFHMELFDDRESGRLTFGECAARRGGGLIQEEVLHKFGVSLAAAAVRCALGEPPVIEPQVRAGAVGCVYLPYTPGVLFSTPSAEELTALPGVEFAMVEYPVGMPMSTMASTLYKVGQAMLVADSQEELSRRADQVVSWFGDRTAVVPPNASPRELREWYSTTAPGGPRPHTAWKR